MLEQRTAYCVRCDQCQAATGKVCSTEYDARQWCLMSGWRRMDKGRILCTNCWTAQAAKKVRDCKLPNQGGLR